MYQSWLPPWDCADPSTHWVSLFTRHGSVLKPSLAFEKWLYSRTAWRGSVFPASPCFNMTCVVCSCKGKWYFNQHSRPKIHWGLEASMWALSLFMYNHLLQCFSIQFGGNTLFHGLDSLLYWYGVSLLQESTSYWHELKLLYHILHKHGSNPWAKCFLRPKGNL